MTTRQTIIIEVTYKARATQTPRNTGDSIKWPKSVIVTPACSKKAYTLYGEKSLTMTFKCECIVYKS